MCALEKFVHIFKGSFIAAEFVIVIKLEIAHMSNIEKTEI